MASPDYFPTRLRASLSASSCEKPPSILALSPIWYCTVGALMTTCQSELPTACLDGHRCLADFLPRGVRKSHIHNWFVIVVQHDSRGDDFVICDERLFVKKDHSGRAVHGGLSQSVGAINFCEPKLNCGRQTVGSIG